MNLKNKNVLGMKDIIKNVGIKLEKGILQGISEIRSDFYTYHLIDSRNDLPFYIGKGFGNRMYRHENNVRRGIIPNKNNTYLFRKIKKIINSGKSIIYEKVIENVEEDHAFLQEIFDIQYCRSLGIELCNLTDGGDGSSPWKYLSKYRKEKISKYMRNLMLGDRNGWRGKHPSVETRKKMIENHADNSGENHPMYGKYALKETKEKMSRFHRNRNFIPSLCLYTFKNIDTKEKIKIINLRKWCIDNSYNHRSFESICHINGINKKSIFGWKCIEKTRMQNFSKETYYNHPYEIIK